MGGTVGASSELGKGSTFRFTVPLAASPEEIVPQADPLPENARLALISPPGRYTDLLRDVLESWGAEMLLIREPFAEPQLPPCTAVLLDRQADAMTVAARMELDPVWKNVPRVLLSFDEPLADEEAALFVKHLLKPVKRNHLAAALADLAGVAIRERGQRVATQPLLALAHPLRILLAEDNFINQKVATALLGRLGYRIDVAANGAEAVECVLRQPYDLVLLDIQMPLMDGVEACLTMRRKLRGRCPRLVALTANAFPGAREEYLQKGFDDYISKPVAPEILKRVLDETVPKEPLRAPSTRLLVRAVESESNNP
jgi:CheY-like chemotaxis protein